jgi:hypothetical protein
LAHFENLNSISFGGILSNTTSKLPWRGILVMSRLGIKFSLVNHFTKEVVDNFFVYNRGSLAISLILLASLNKMKYEEDLVADLIIL